MDPCQSLICEWLISGEESKFSKLLSLGPIKEFTEVPEMLCKSWGLRPEQCDSYPDIKAAFNGVLGEVQVNIKPNLTILTNFKILNIISPCYS